MSSTMMMSSLVGHQNSMLKYAILKQIERFIKHIKTVLTIT